MATGDTVKTKGSTLSIANGTGTPLLIGEANNLVGLGGNSTRITLEAWANTFMRSRAGRANNAEATFDVLLDQDDTGQIECRSVRASGVIRQFVLTLPSGTANIFTFSGYVKNIGYSAADNNVWRAKITVKVTTTVVRT